MSGDLGFDAQPGGDPRWEEYVRHRAGRCEVCGGTGAETWIDQPTIRRKHFFGWSEPEHHVMLSYLCRDCGLRIRGGLLTRAQEAQRQGTPWVTTSRGVQRGFFSDGDILHTAGGDE